MQIDDVRRQLICRASAEAVMLCPPLVTTTAQIDEIVATLADVTADLQGA